MKYLSAYVVAFILCVACIVPAKADIVGTMPPRKPSARIVDLSQIPPPPPLPESFEDAPAKAPSPPPCTKLEKNRITSRSAPAALSVSIGGPMGRQSYSLEIIDGVLLYTASTFKNPKQSAQCIVPSEQAWQRFRQQLDAIGVWSWEHSYANMHVMDGTFWSAQIAYPDKTLKTQGMNAYPEDAGTKHAQSAPEDGPIMLIGSSSETDVFKAYLAAVSELSGGRDFQ